jgi:hypothetical protein
MCSCSFRKVVVVDEHGTEKKRVAKREREREEGRQRDREREGISN